MTTRADYAALRAAGWPARVAYGTARRLASRAPSLIDELDYGSPVTWSAAPWTLRATVDYDCDADGTDWYGTFTDRAGDDTIPAEADGRNRRPAAYFRPEYSIAERTAANRAYGMARDDARREALASARRDMLRARDYTALFVTVTASRAGIELGRASCGGVDITDSAYDPLPYSLARALARADLADVVDDLARDALVDANATLPAVLASLAAAR